MVDDLTHDHGETTPPEQAVNASGAQVTVYAASDGDETRLELVKNGHRYVFSYAQGEESKLLASVLDMARDPEYPLDMFDAALLSHQIGRSMAQQLRDLVRPSPEA